MSDQPWKDEGMTKAEWVAKEVAQAVNAGKEWDLDTVDFADPLRPLTCLEVDFPIIPINQIAAIEGNAGKPIYQMSKWWARRRSSVFRSMLIAAATKAPDDPAEAAKTVWNAYYGNHQARGAFKNLKVADIFMGGGTTIIEGSRLGMQMFGNDLNPVAWFVVKNEMAQVDRAEVEALLAEIEAEVKPQIMPFYACDCPRGHKGKWFRRSGKMAQKTGEKCQTLDFDGTGVVYGPRPTVEESQWAKMPDTFDPLGLSPGERKQYRYEGPETIYVFWAKHGPCQVTGCGHRTPIMSTPVMAVKTLSVRAWSRRCQHCGEVYDLEERDARMAPGMPLLVADTEVPFAVASLVPGKKDTMIPGSAVCPLCGETESFTAQGTSLEGKPKNKSVDLTLLVHPDWLRGESPKNEPGQPYGGSADDDLDATVRWNDARARTCRLVEVRGKLPDTITCPETGVTFQTGKDGGTVPGKSRFACGACGTTHDIRNAIAATETTGPVAMYALQGYCPECDQEGHAYNGRFFSAASSPVTFNAALREWAARKDADLAGLWPTSEVPFGFMTAMNNGDIRLGHGFTHWWKMFNPRQLFVHAALLKAISQAHGADAAEFVLGGWQQLVRYQCMFAFWQQQYDKMIPHFSNNNYHPKNTPVEGSMFSAAGAGNFGTLRNWLCSAVEWESTPWEMVANEGLKDAHPQLHDAVTGKSEKAPCGDPVVNGTALSCCSSTELTTIAPGTHDMVITDPPFGGLLHYSELSDFFYVWLRLALKDKYPDYFTAEYTPKTLEAVANRARQDDPDAFYQRLLTECWREAHRILKPGGILAFTFHHSEDAPWVSVLESLFEAGFYLQATYPLRGDETKGEGSKPGTFGSQKIEYDIIHVCRKRTEDPMPVSWARLRRQILSDVRELQELLEHHSEEGLPEADLQVIRRGKALEYFSRHYGQVFKEPGSPMKVIEALVGVNQLLEEESGGAAELPPSNAEPFTRMLLRLFDGTSELARDQIQKFLRGTGCGPSDFVDREWVTEQSKVFHLAPALDMARGWIGKKRKTMTSDYDQAMFFVGACHEGSGINASETLNNPNFRPHPALGSLLQWFRTHGGDTHTRNAAIIASQLYHTWESRNAPKVEQLLLEFGDM